MPEMWEWQRHVVAEKLSAISYIYYTCLALIGTPGSAADHLMPSPSFADIQRNRPSARRPSLYICFCYSPPRDKIVGRSANGWYRIERYDAQSQNIQIRHTFAFAIRPDPSNNKKGNNFRQSINEEPADMANSLWAHLRRLVGVRI